MAVHITAHGSEYVPSRPQVIVIGGVDPREIARGIIWQRITPSRVLPVAANAVFGALPTW